MSRGCLQYIGKVDTEISIWRLEEQGGSRWTRWHRIKLILLKQEPMHARHSSHVPVWHGQEEALYYTARGSLSRYSIKQRNLEEIRGWERLPHFSAVRMMLLLKVCFII